MTIAACYLSLEGVVFGADSTTTMAVRDPGPPSGVTLHHYHHAQKIFQLCVEGTLGMTTWGLSNLPSTSYRTLIARFTDLLTRQAPPSVGEVAERWNHYFWSSYVVEFSAILRRVQQLRQQPTRSPEE